MCYELKKDELTQYIKDIITTRGLAQDKAFEYDRVGKIFFEKQLDTYYTLTVHFYDYWDGDCYFVLNSENLNRAQYNSICNYVSFLLCNKQKDLMKEYNKLNQDGLEIQQHVQRINTLLKQDRKV